MQSPTTTGAGRWALAKAGDNLSGFGLGSGALSVLLLLADPVFPVPNDPSFLQRVWHVLLVVAVSCVAVAVVGVVIALVVAPYQQRNALRAMVSRQIDFSSFRFVGLDPEPAKPDPGSSTLLVPGGSPRGSLRVTVLNQNATGFPLHYRMEHLVVEFQGGSWTLEPNDETLRADPGPNPAKFTPFDSFLINSTVGVGTVEYRLAFGVSPSELTLRRSQTVQFRINEVFGNPTVWTCSVVIQHTEEVEIAAAVSQ